jgi:crossover junction endodeoxyribonuclease RusA
MTTISMPWPPSIHKVFKRHNGKFMSAEYRRWRDEAGWLLKAQKPAAITGPVSVRIDLCAPDKRRRDSDNYTKAPLDLLVAHGVIEADDSRILKSITARWVESGEPCVVFVEAA